MLAHVTNLPADSAIERKRQMSPLGWSNDTELAAATVDAVNVLTRMLSDSTEPPPRVPRPYDVAAEPVAPETISLAAFGDMLKE